MDKRQKAPHERVLRSAPHEAREDATSPTSRILEGKAKGPRPGETTNESYDAASALAHLGSTYHPPRTINEGPFQGRLEFSWGLLWAENQTHKSTPPRQKTRGGTPLDRTPLGPSP